ncbi:hypothetical protein BRC62_06505 [Halobacteriales archaeon QH_10_67_13]|nr:MAG: hypothetical protein BRC62_06505 [Halobacteriales archaeon QH_10_67_13]
MPEITDRATRPGGVLSEAMTVVQRAAGFVGSLAGGLGGVSADHDRPRPDASVTFEAQKTDGRTVTVQRVSTSVEAMLVLQTAETRIAEPLELNAADRRS